MMFKRTYLSLLIGILSVSSSSETARKEILTSCSKGWFSFGNMCYSSGGKSEGKLNWEMAANCCKEYGGQLATIDSHELMEFVRAFIMMDVKSALWIGMHDRVNESVYQWMDGTEVDYTNWEPSEPSGTKDEKEDCVEMVFYSLRPGGQPGNWNDIDCNWEREFVCQKKKNKQARKSSDPRFCPPRIGGWRLRTSCYQIVPEKLSWTDAEEYCIKNHKGHLVAIKDFTIHLFLEFILKNYTEDMWIGIKIKDGFQQQWSSGWFVSYTNWADVDSEITEGACTSRSSFQDWITLPCAKSLPFICETSADLPPTLKSFVNSHCPEDPNDWRDLGGHYCYYFDTKSRVSWLEAHFTCMRRGGTLVSIHSQEEAQAIQQFLLYNQYAFWIGLYRSMLKKANFVWVDGTRVDYTSWAQDEPNSNKEQCVELRTHTLEWNDITCDQTRGFICSILKISTHGNKTIESKVVAPSCSNGIPLQSLLGVALCVLFVATLMGVVVYFFRRTEDVKSYEKTTRKSSRVSLPPSSRDQKPQYRSVSEIVIEDDSYERLTC